MCQTAAMQTSFDPAGTSNGPDRVRTIKKLVAVKQWNNAADDLQAAMVRFFQAQVADVAGRLATMPPTTGPDLAGYAGAIFNPRAWDRPLQMAAAPPLAKAMAQGAISEMVQLGWQPAGSAAKATTAAEYIASLQDLPEDWAAEGLGAGGSFGFETEMPNWLKNAVKDNIWLTMQQPYWKKVNDTTRANIETILKKGATDGMSTQDIAKAITAAGPGYSKARAMRVSRTEVGNALNAGRNMAFAKLQKDLPAAMRSGLGKEWLSVLGNTTRPTHADADGQIATGEYFTVGGYKAPWPAYYGLPAAERIQCQCTMTVAMGVNAPPEAVQWILDGNEGLPGDKPKPAPKPPKPKPAPKPAPTPKPEPASAPAPVMQPVPPPKPDSAPAPIPAAVPAGPPKPKLPDLEGRDYQREINKWIARMPEDQSDAISMYTGAFYSQIRDCLALQNCEQWIHGPIDHLKQAIKSAPQGEGTVWRGLNLETAGKKQEWLAKIIQNKEFTDPSFMSTTLDEKIARHFAKKGAADAQIILKINGARSGAWIAKLSQFAQEEEFLMQPGVKFRLVDIQAGPPGKPTIVELEEV